MKKYLLSFLAILSFLFSAAQTFNGTGGTIPNIGNASFPINVSGIGNINTGFGVASVCFSLNRNTPDQDLEIVLMAPDGTNVPLSMQNGGNGQNFTNTCFSGTATVSIRNGTAPFSGTYLPDAYLGGVNNGQNANGTWILFINDRRNNSGSSSLLNWSLTFSNSPAPLPPSLPPCSVTLPSGTTCAAATSICDFSGLCGNTNGTTVSTWTGSGLAGCFGLENNTFLKFVAASTSASFSVWVPTHSASTYINSGIQMLFFSGTCGSGSVTTYGCYPHILAYGSASKPVVNLVSATGLTPGNTYYLMIDGYGGDKCTFVIEANQGLNVVNVNPSSPSICEGGNVNLTATGGGGNYTWSPPTGLSQNTGSTVNAAPTSTTTYIVTSILNGVCPATRSVTVTVNPVPVISAHPSVTPQTTCLNGSLNALTVSASISTGTVSYQWYSNTVSSATGGTLIAGATGSTYMPSAAVAGTLYYYCVVNSANNCDVSSNVSGPVTVSSTLAAPAASVSQQPNCAIPTGTITFTSPAGANIEYSIGGTYQSGAVFSGLSPNNYNLTVRDNSSGCISPTIMLTVNAAPGSPSAPTASATQQPSCAQPTGTITITAPSGTNLQYSIGAAYQASPVFSAVLPNTYNVTVKDISSGCISTATSITINPAPGAPATPIVSIQQISCTVLTGTITVVSPAGPNIQYSIGGAYQGSGVFAGLAPNNYNVTAKDISSGCISPVTSAVVNTAPAVPPSPTASVTQQPTCVLITGTISITAPAGANIEYSIGGAYQASPVFTGLASNSYNITVKDISTQCVSAITTITVNPVPVPPLTPTAVVTQQPTCSVPTGTIVISAPTGTNLEYSIGGTFQSATTFAGLVPNVYSITVRDNSSHCISPVKTLTVNPVLGAPAMPNAAVTQQPTCSIPTGTITISTPIGANIEYSIGAAYQGSGIFSGLLPNTYSITAKDIATGCTSAPLSLTVNPVSGAPAAPVVSNAAICGGGSVINLTATGSGTINWYSDIALTNLVATGTTFSPTVTATSSFYVTSNVLSCTSSIATSLITVHPVPLPSFGSINTICLGDSLILNPGTFASYLWQNSSTQPSLTVKSSGNYSVEVTNSQGCKNSALVNVSVKNDCGSIYFPGAFTPNGDEKNDRFGPLPESNLFMVKNYVMKIYNRYGEMVFETNDPLKKWSGNYKGKLLSGTYVWYAGYSYKGGRYKIYNGTVVIVK